MAKVLGIVGSARKKNTYFLIDAILDVVKRKAKDAKTQLITLSDMNIGYCTGCNDYCKKSGKCKHHDDMQKLCLMLERTNVLIIGTPTYFWNVSGLVKNFIDRCIPLYYRGVLKGKIGVAVAVSGGDGQDEALSAIGNFFHLQGLKEIRGIAIACGKSGVGKKELEIAKELGERIVAILE